MSRSRSSVVRPDHIDYCLHLVFDVGGGVRMTRLAGSTRPHERAMQLTVRLPKSVFDVVALRAAIQVDDVITTPKIDISATQEALRRAIGAEVLITVEAQEQPE